MLGACQGRKLRKTRVFRKLRMVQKQWNTCVFRKLRMVPKQENTCIWGMPQNTASGERGVQACWGPKQHHLGIRSRLISFRRLSFRNLKRGYDFKRGGGSHEALRYRRSLPFLCTSRSGLAFICRPRPSLNGRSELRVFSLRVPSCPAASPSSGSAPPLSPLGAAS